MRQQFFVSNPLKNSWVENNANRIVLGIQVWNGLNEFRMFWINSSRCMNEVLMGLKHSVSSHKKSHIIQDKIRIQGRNRKNILCLSLSLSVCAFIESRCKTVFLG